MSFQAAFYVRGGMIYCLALKFKLIDTTPSFQGNVEVWLNTLLKESRTSLHSVIRTASIAIKDPNFKLKDFLDTFPAQVKQL